MVKGQTQVLDGVIPLTVLSHFNDNTLYEFTNMVLVKWDRRKSSPNKNNVQDKWSIFSISGTLS